MSFTTIQTRLTDTAIGQNAVDDSICMLVAPAVATTGTSLSFELNQPYLCTSTRDVEDMGITEENNETLLWHVQEFYEQATNGAKLWIVGYTPSLAGMQAAITGVENFVKYTGENVYGDRPRIVGIAGDVEFVTGTASGSPVPAETIANIQAFNTVLTNLFSDAYQSFRAVGVIDGLELNCPSDVGISAIPNSTSLQDLGALNCPRVAAQFTTSTPGKTASIGQTLGKIASVSIGTSIGITTAGQISQHGYFIDAFESTYVNTNVARLTAAKAQELGEKQYLFTRIRQQTSGVFYNDDATCNTDIMALSAISRIRVGNSVCDTVERYFVRTMNANAPVTPTGDIDPGYRDALISTLDSQFLRSYRINGDVNDIQVNIAARDNNLVATSTIDVTVRIQPPGVIKQVYVETTFVVDLTA